jgi:hypothetical protein
MSSQSPMPPPTPGPPRGGGGWNMPVVVPGQGFNALLGRFYDEFGNTMNRNADAFELYKRKKAMEEDQWKKQYEQMLWERKQREAQAALEAEQLRKAEEARQAALKLQETERQRAENEKRGALNAAIGANAGRQGGAAPFTPDNTVAQFYGVGPLGSY